MLTDKDYQRIHNDVYSRIRIQYLNSDDIEAETVAVYISLDTSIVTVIERLLHQKYEKPLTSKEVSEIPLMRKYPVPSTGFNEEFENKIIEDFRKFFDLNIKFLFKDRDKEV